MKKEKIEKKVAGCIYKAIERRMKQDTDILVWNPYCWGVFHQGKRPSNSEVSR